MIAKSTLFNNLECLIGISITEKDCISHVKNSDIFHVFKIANQLMTRHVFYLAPWKVARSLFETYTNFF